MAIRIRFGRKRALQAALVAAAGLLSFLLGYYNFGHDGYGNAYYTAALRSMTESWHNFFFVSFDPAGFISVDKPPVALWIEALFVRLFGFSGAVVLLPGALAAAFSVLLLFRMVQRAFGFTAGLLSSSALAVTPIFVAASRSNNPDAILAFFLLLAAWAALRAAETARLRWFLLTGVFLGLAFNTKTLVACLALPACGLAFLCTKLSFRRMAVRLAAVAAVFVAVSFAWIAAVDATPASRRPFVGSSANNTEFNLTFGYNGFGRVFRPAAPARRQEGVRKAGLTVRTGKNGAAARTASGPETGSDRITPDSRVTLGPFRLLNQPYGDQIGWLMALALAGGCAAAVWLWEARKRVHVMPPAVSAGAGPAPLLSADAWMRDATSPISLGSGTAESGMVPNDSGGPKPLPAPFVSDISVDLPALSSGCTGGRQQLASLLLWGGWALAMTLFFSVYRSLTHRYYLNIIAPGIAALCGIGVVCMVRLARQHARSWHTLFLPAAFLAGAALELHILSAYPAWRNVLWPFTTLAALLGVLAWMAAFRAPHGKNNGRLAGILAVAAFFSLLAAPFAWSMMAVAGHVSGGDAAAGPSALGDVRAKAGISALVRLLGDDSTASPKVSASQRGLETYLLSNRNGAVYLAATLNAAGAENIIIDTGEPVMAVGGFSGSNPVLTLTQFQTLAAQGKVRYFWVTGTSSTGRESAESDTGSMKRGNQVQSPRRANIAAKTQGDIRFPGREKRGNSKRDAQEKPEVVRGGNRDVQILAWVRQHSSIVPRGAYAKASSAMTGTLYRLNTASTGSAT